MDNIHVSQVSEGAPSAAWGKYPFLPSSVPESSIMFPYQW